MKIAKGATWRKSSRSSGGSSNCVELADLGEGVAVRDSKNPGGGVLVLGPAARGRFLAGIRRGRFEG